jgi:outer membrane receptor for ferrienterochelin and colicins
MKGMMLVFSVLLLCNAAIAQAVFKIIDTDGVGIEDAFVMALCKKTQKEYIGFTDSKGLLKIPFSSETKVQIKKLGYKVYTAGIVFSDTVSISMERDNISINDVVITGQTEATATQASVSNIKIIDRKKIEAMGAVNLRDALTNQLNTRIAQDNVLGASISLNGVSGQGIKLLIDGVPVIGRMDGSIDLTQINLSNIERIEIVEGPMSVIYGSDAMGGVINLISKRKLKEEATGSLNTYYESNGTYNIDGRLSFKWKDILFSTSGGRNFFDGYSPDYDWRKRTMQWKPRTQYLNDNNLSFKIGPTRHVLFSSSFHEKITNRGLPAVTPYSAYGVDEYYYTRRWSVGMQSDVYIKGNNNLQLITSFSHYRRIKNTYRKDLTTGNSELTPTAIDDDTSTFYLLLFRGTWNNTRLSTFQFQAGYDFNIETAAGQRLENNLQTIQDYALFTTIQYTPIKRVSIKGGVRAAYNTRYGTPVVPSFHFKFDVTKVVTLRLSYAQGFRAPSLKELSMFFVDVNHNIKGNANLKAERSHNTQLELSYQPAVKDFTFALKPSFFFNHIGNMISLALLDPSMQLYSYINVDKFQSTGFNVNGNINHKYFELNAGMAYTGRYNQLSRSRTDVPHFNWAAEFSSSVSVNIPKINTSLAAFYKFNGAIPGFALDEDDNLYQTWVQSYSMLDASVSVRVWKERFVVTAGAKNILNVKDISYNSPAGGAHSSGGNSMSVGMGITGFVTLKINLSNNLKNEIRKMAR